MTKRGLSPSGAAAAGEGCCTWTSMTARWYIFFSSRRRHARFGWDWSSDVCSSDLGKVSYDGIAARLQKIIHSGSQRKAITDFVCRELRKIPHYTWVGIYSVEGPELRLAWWSGPSATQHTRISIGQGICGAAVAEKATVVVQDVNEDPRYLQCFINTRAEIVVPILRDGAPIAEIDIDSDQVNAFGPTDREFLEWVASDLAAIL